jgi:hypothetical protein
MELIKRRRASRADALGVFSALDTSACNRLLAGAQTNGLKCNAVKLAATRPIDCDVHMAVPMEQRGKRD